MPLFRHKPTIIEARPWNRHGDHAGVEELRPFGDDGLPKYDCQAGCPHPDRDHGYIKRRDGGALNGLKVCPGDFIVVGPFGELIPMKPAEILASHDIISPSYSCPCGEDYYPIVVDSQSESLIYSGKARVCTNPPAVVCSTCGAPMPADWFVSKGKS